MDLLYYLNVMLGREISEKVRLDCLLEERHIGRFYDYKLEEHSPEVIVRTSRILGRKKHYSPDTGRRIK